MVTLGIQFSNLSLYFNRKTNKIHLISSLSIINLLAKKATASWLVSATVRPAGVGQGSYPLLDTGEAAPRILCSVLDPSPQEGCRGAGACPEKGNEAKESRAQVF